MRPKKTRVLPLAASGLAMGTLVASAGSATAAVNARDDITCRVQGYILSDGSAAIGTECERSVYQVKVHLWAQRWMGEDKGWVNVDYDSSVDYTTDFSGYAKVSWAPCRDNGYRMAIQHNVRNTEDSSMRSWWNVTGRFSCG